MKKDSVYDRSQVFVVIQMQVQNKRREDLSVIAQHTRLGDITMILSPMVYYVFIIKSIVKQKNRPRKRSLFFSVGDPYGNRTHVTAVKGPCLSRLTNGPLVAEVGLEPTT